jgi:hypothetical protein
LPFCAQRKLSSQSLDESQFAPAPAFVVHAPHCDPAVVLQRRPAHCAPSPQGAPSASCPAGVLHASSGPKTVSHVADEYADAQALTADGVAPDDGAFADFTHWSFCRATQSLTSLYESRTSSGAHSFNLLQIAFTS